jgi:hypothetical protein
MSIPIALKTTFPHIGSAWRNLTQVSHFSSFLGQSRTKWQSVNMKAQAPSTARDQDNRWSAFGAILAALVSVGCDEDAPALSKAGTADTPGDSEEFESPDLGAIKEDGPRIGAVIDRAPIYAAAHKKAPIIGYLHAGDTVARSEDAHENDQCTEGWYRVHPRGYMCTEKAASTNMEHPTLRTMALGANLDGALPYTYARTTKVTALFDKKSKKGVELGGRLAKSTVMAIVGSWTAPDESKEPQRLGLKMDGRFVRADDLEAAQGSSFVGAHLTDELALPLAYVLRRGVRKWKMKDGTAIKTEELPYHTRLELTGRYRTVQGNQFWATENDEWVRHKDVTILRKRHEFPEFATGEQKWVDISIVTGAAIAYEGKKPVFATLVSVGRDRLGDPQATASTERGTFRVVQKQITQRSADSPDTPLHDAPWALKLESGDWLYASPNHDRFGIEHTDGNVELSPKDGHFLWNWSAPTIPKGWHGLVVEPAQETTIVQIRK